MKSNRFRRALSLAAATGAFVLALGAQAQSPATPAPAAPAPAPAAPGAPAAPSEAALGELVITGHKFDKLPRIAILPSLSPDLEDVMVRSVVRHDLALTGMFDIIKDADAPPGMYSFDDPVDIDAWKKLGAEAIVKVAARVKNKKVEVFGIAYFLNVGKEPVYQKKLTIEKAEVRVTAHRITDALLGALTGRPGGFASQFTFSARWTKNRRVFRMDADGHGLTPLTDPADTAIAPTWGPDGVLFYPVSRAYSPFTLESLLPGAPKSVPVKLPVATSIHSVAFNKDFTKIAIAVAENAKSAIYVGKADGSDLKKASTTELATHPVFSPSGKLAWIGGDAKHGSQRVYVEGKAASPSGFPASAPAYCDTEDGVRLVYAVAVGGDRQDLVMSGESGGSMSRLTQNQGSNTYPACSPDGRLLAFFSTRKSQPGLYMMSLKRFTTQQVSAQTGESLRWAALPGESGKPAK
ncbi:MAG TPA: tolB protein [Polyangiaceae bacterium]